MQSETVRHAGKQFKTLKLALNELQRFVPHTKLLYSGKPFPNFDDMRPRELLGNWLICACMNDSAGQETFTVGSGDDGLIVNRDEEHGFQTEHVMVPRAKPGNSDTVHSAICDAVNAKQTKGGAAYAEGKVLVIFLDLGGNDAQWYPNRIADTLPANDFDAVWVIVLQSIEDGAYIYGVTLLERLDGKAPTWIVRIEANFDEWTVERRQ